MAAEHRATATVSAGALAVVVDELDNLPRIDDRYRLWPWSLRALARRRRCSPGTVHKHLRSLRAAGVLVDDETNRTLLDTTRVPRDGALTGHQGGSAVPTERARTLTWASAAPRRPGAADVLAAIEALTCAVEAHTAHAGVLLPVIERLARLLIDDPADEPLEQTARHGLNEGARPGAPRESDASVVDQAERAAGTEPGARAEARDRARSPKKEREKDPSSFRARDVDLPGPSFSLTSRSRDSARAGGARAEGARSAERLLELLGPLDPARHVTYLEGVRAALAGYDDRRVTYAVGRITQLGDVCTNPVGLLVDRASSHDPVYFPTAVPSSATAVDDREDLPDLWSSDQAPTPDDADTDELPEFDPDATLAARLAARAALEAARQPGPVQLAAGQNSDVPTVSGLGVRGHVA